MVCTLFSHIQRMASYHISQAEVDQADQYAIHSRFINLDWTVEYEVAVDIQSRFQIT